MYTPRWHVVLYQPEIPYNTGSVGRTCVAVGAKLWLVRPLGFRVDAYHLRRAGMDYWQHLEWEVVDDWQALQSRLDRPMWFFSKKAEQSYLDVPLSEGDVFVYGPESQGLPDSLLSDASRALRIPIRPEAAVLNLSNAAAITLFEAQRQATQE